jgi:hypothetical protein
MSASFRLWPLHHHGKVPRYVTNYTEGRVGHTVGDDKALKRYVCVPIVKLTCLHSTDRTLLTNVPRPLSYNIYQ